MWRWAATRCILEKGTEGGGKAAFTAESGICIAVQEKVGVTSGWPQDETAQGRKWVVFLLLKLIAAFLVFRDPPSQLGCLEPGCDEGMC